MSLLVNRQSRIEYFDFLRIIATYAVIVIHIFAPLLYSISIKTVDWQIINICNSLSRWSVPIFFMISGTLFLGSNRDIKTIMKKNVLHIITAFCFWSFLHSAVSFLRGNSTLTEAIIACFLGHYHMWFLYAIVGLYLVVPILRKLVESQEITRLFLILSLLFGSVLPQIAHCIGLVSETAEYILVQMLGRLQFTSIANYAFYFLLGYTLHYAVLTQRHKKIIYIFGFLGALTTILFTAVLSIWKHEFIEIFYEYNTVNVICVSVAFFVYAREHFCYKVFSRKTVSFIQKMSGYSFGVYLMHLLVLDAVNQMFRLDGLPPILSAFVTVTLVFVISYGVCAVFHLLPVLKKYVV